MHAEPAERLHASKTLVPLVVPDVGSQTISGSFRFESRRPSSNDVPQPVRRVSAQLREKSFASLRRAIGAFNSPDNDGRQTAVILHLQH